MLIVMTLRVDALPYLLDGRDPGRWTPGADVLLGLTGAVARDDLRRVLEGRDPATGRFLPAAHAARRRAGWDLVFAAPKSVSLLAATAGSERRRAIETAHIEAVAGTVAHLETGLRVRATLGTEPGSAAAGLIGAAFVHRENAAHQPHLHTHLVVANLSRSGPTWGAIDAAEWRVDRRALTARYQLELRHQMALAGLGADWRVGESGLADVAAVPRSAVREASAQKRLVATLGRFAARSAAVPAGWDAAAVRAAVDASPLESSPPPAVADLHRAVSARLTAARSDFRRGDVAEALAACHPSGMANAEVSKWVDRYCRESVPVASPTSSPRWTTPAARGIDTRLTDALVNRRGPSAVFLSGPPGDSRLIAHAELIARLARQWSAEGATVAVDAQTPEAAQRWEVLTGVGPARPGLRPDVLIVDTADRRHSHALLQLARTTTARLVLVEGGTRPRLGNPVSHGARDAADEVGRTVSPEPDPWRLGAPSLRLSRDPPGRLVGREAAEAVLAAWDGAGREGLLVGLGRDEVIALNRAAAGDREAGHLQRGDPVVVLRGGRGLPRWGTFGTVTGTGPLRVAWAGAGETDDEPAGRRRIGLAWAVTPAVARVCGSSRDPFVLAPGQDLSQAAELVESRSRRALRPEPPGLGL